MIALVLARPVWLAALLAALCLAAALGVRDLRVRADLSGLISVQAPAVQALIAYNARFTPLAGDEVLLVSARDGGALDLAALEGLVLDLRFLPGVADVHSLLSLPAITAQMDPTALAARRRADPLLAQALSADLSATLVLIEPDGLPSAALVQGIAAITAPGLVVQAAGLGAVHRSIGQALIQDLTVLTPLATLICALVTALMFRSLSAVVICALPPLVGVLWTLGWMGAVGRPIDPMMGALPVVLIVLGFSDGMHLFHAYGRAHAGARRARITRALAETLPAAALTSLTTAIAFGALLLADAPSIRGLAVAGMVGMGFTLASFGLLTPLLLLALGGARRAPMPRVLSLPVGPARALAHRGGTVALVAVALLALLAVIQSRAETGFRYAEYLPHGGTLTAALARAEQLALGTDEIRVVVEAAPAIDSAPGPGPANLRAAARAIWGEGAPDAQGAWLAPLDDPAVLARLAARDGSAWALPVQLPIAPGDAPAMRAITDLEARLSEAGLGDVTKIVGASYALMQEGPRLIDSLRAGLYATIAAVTLLIGWVFRSWRLAAVALVPNLIPVLGVESALVLAGREVTIMAAIALTVAFGIAVDDTLHLLNRFRLARGGTSRRVALALHRATPPMMATTLIVTAGLTVTAFSAIPGIATFGAMIALAVVLALLADLFLLPGLIRWAVR